MTQIRPVSDLRNSFADISRTVHETGEPVILTKNGYGDMVVLAYESYQSIQFEMGVVRELRAEKGPLQKQNLQQPLFACVAHSAVKYSRSK